MKKINSRIFFSLLAILIISFACSEKDLEVTSTTENSETYYIQDENVEPALWMAYNSLLIRTGPWGNSPIAWGSFASDDAYAGGADDQDQESYQNADNYTSTPVDPANNLATMWKIYFQGIYACNLVIDNVKEGKPFNNQAIAEAKFLKGFYYFYLARMFGGLPLLEKTATPSDQFPRATQSETYEYIEQLLNEAINSGAMQQRSGLSDPENGRATLASAQALLGKVYMYNKKYSEAISVLKKVADNPNYALESDFNRLFLASTKHSKESIFEINYAKIAGANGEALGNGDIQLFGARTVSGLPINDTIIIGWGFNQPTQDLVNAYNSINDDIRLKATVISSDSLNKLANRTEEWVNNPDGYWDKKHLPDPRAQGVSWSNFRNNCIILRLADVYLLLAEAYNMTGDNANALKYVNLVRERAKLAPLTSSGTALLSDIKLERRLELALEGDRYFDLVRWGDAATVLGPLGYTDGYPGVKTNGLFPIPQNEINRTDGENALKQNEGY